MGSHICKAYNPYTPFCQPRQHRPPTLIWRLHCKNKRIWDHRIANTSAGQSPYGVSSPTIWAQSSLPGTIVIRPQNEHHFPDGMQFHRHGSEHNYPHQLIKSLVTSFLSFQSDPTKLTSVLDAADHRRAILAVGNEVDIVSACPVARHLNDSWVNPLGEIGPCFHIPPGRFH